MSAKKMQNQTMLKVGLFLLLLILIVALVFSLRGKNLMPVWLLLAGIMIMLLLLLGVEITQNLFGALIDPKRKLYSLSQLQLVVWTVMIISAWLAIAATRIVVGVVDPLNVDIPGEVLALLGISAGSLVSAAQIKSGQETVHVAGENEKPSWADFWRGDQKGDYNNIDIGKFQMFWFTLAAVAAYGMQIFSMLNQAMADVELIKQLTSLPQVDPSLVGVLGISHLGYLANKVPKRP